MGKIRIGERKDLPAYPDAKDAEDRMFTLPEYLNQAEAIVRTFASKTHLKHILDNDDAMAFVAYWLMLADRRYEEGRGTKQSSYRVNTGRFAIKRYLYRRFQLSHLEKMKQYLSSMSYSGLSWDKYYHRGKKNVKYDKLMVHKKTDAHRRHDSDLSEGVLEMLKDKSLTSRESLAIHKVYLEGYTQEEVGKQLGVSKSCIGWYLKTGIGKLRVKSHKYKDLFESM